MTEPMDRGGDSADVGSQAAPVGRSRSSIRFPYADLDVAVSVADGVQRFGVSAEAGQLASALNVDAGTAGYRTRVATANIFGLVSTPRGGAVELTELGRRIIDPQTRADAKVEAFLKVPLYDRIYELFSGGVLPQADSGLEHAMGKAGVPGKQAVRARQAFNRSAEQAGFFRAGRKRLVKPPAATLRGSAGPVAEGASSAPLAADSEAEVGVLQDSLLAGLFKRMLPAEGDEFSARERKRFFRALAVNLDVIYGEPSDGSLDPDQLARLFHEEPQRSVDERQPATA